jgi:hypothetical protein
MPTDGVATGLGGTTPAPGAGPPAAPWLVTAAAGGLLALAGGVALWRIRHNPQHA